MKKPTLALISRNSGWKLIIAILLLTTAAYAGSVSISSPTAGSTVGSPVRFVASATSSAPITGMKIYVDGASKYASAASKIDTYLSLPSGSRYVVITAWDSTGAAFSATRTINVSGTSTTTSNLSVSSPTAGATVTSPFRVVASHSAAKTIKVYVDNVIRYSADSTKIDAAISASSGSRYVVVQSWDAYGSVKKVALTVNVATSSSSTTDTPTAPATGSAITSTGPLSIKTTSLPSCIAKAPCAMVLVGGGGSRDDLYEWSVASGSLPTGMILDRNLGAIYTTDTPTPAGNFTFTIRVQDAAGATAVRTFTLAVKANSTIGIPVSAPQKLAANNTYIVQKPLYCAETCFAFTGDNITLDCNGHKLTYNTSGSPDNYGVAAVADYDAQEPIDRDWTGRGSNLTIKNCRIEESDNSVSRSHGIRVGQGGTVGLTVLNTEVTTKKTSSEPFYGSFSQKHTFKQNIFKNRGPAPSNRSMLEGVSIRRYGGTTTQLNLLEDNVLLNSPQGGVIFTNSPNTVIRRNAMKLSAVSTNAFGVYAWNSGVQIYDNTIDNYDDDLVVDGLRTAGGRGIQIGGGSLTSSAIEIYNNMIRVREVNRNAEYNGCVSAGAFGVQFETRARNSRVFGNTIVAVAKECDATALRVTSSTTASTENYENTVYSNVLVGKRIGSTSKFAVGIHDAYGQWLSMINNKWIVDSGVMGGRYEKTIGGLFFSGNTFAKGSNPSTKWGVWADVGACHPKVDTHSFVDNYYLNGASEISTYPAWNHSCAGTGDYKKFRYRVGWSYDLILNSSKGGALAGATVTVKNNTGATTFTGTTDSTGRVLASVYVRSVYNTNALARVTTNFTNTVTISKTGCTTQSYSYNPTGPTKQTRSVSCQ